MPESARLNISPEEIDRRLNELGRLYELGQALREVRLLDAPQPDRVLEMPELEKGQSSG